MKKIVSLLVAVLLIAGCACISAVAASPEKNDVVESISAVDNNGSNVSVTLVKSEKVDKKLQPTANDEVMVSQYDFEIEGNPEYPLTITMKVAGVKKNSKVYLLASDEDGNVEKIEVKITDDGLVEFTIDKNYANLAIITDKQTAKAIGVSDKTGDSVTPAVMTVLLIAVCALAVSVKKVKA